MKRKKAIRKALQDAAVAFREYEAHHLAKLDEPGRGDKAERNRILAQACEVAAALIPAK